MRDIREENAKIEQNPQHSNNIIEPGQSETDILDLIALIIAEAIMEGGENGKG